jgi:hypothetical protein
MTGNYEAVTARLAATLRSSVNRDGGWGYFQGNTSRLEPTCWVALALLDGGAAREDDAIVAGALSRMEGWQGPDGLLSEMPGVPPNLAFNGLAAVAYQRALATRPGDPRQHRQFADAILAGILTIEGTRLPQEEVSRQNNQLSAWPWTNGTFSWVEPTAWCLLALKKAPAAPRRERAGIRIAEAERTLADRCCVSGGWNTGNSNMLGKELLPYVPTSALALLALQDRRALPEVPRSVAWLTANWQREPSPLALSLTQIAMSLHRQSPDDVERALRAHVAAAGPAQNIATRAISLYALSGSRHEYAALAV